MSAGAIASGSQFDFAQSHRLFVVVPRYWPAAVAWGLATSDGTPLAPRGSGRQTPQHSTNINLR
jgi:hypothetical protein